AAADIPGRRDEGSRRAHDARIGDGEALRERDRRAGRRRLCPDSRRLRLREGLPGGEILSRREAHDHRRRHQRDPAPRDRPADALLTSTTDLADRIVAGDARAIARAISLIEDEDPSAPELVRAIFGRTGRAYLVGITGPPGAGKS